MSEKQRKRETKIPWSLTELDNINNNNNHNIKQ